MRRLFDRRMKKMAIRAYRRPIQLPALRAMQPDDNVKVDEGTAYIDIFVIMDSPLLELTHKDLVMLRGMKIDPFIEVG
jgi:hypothetical protein